jgi:CRP-like cAMP-binding protein
MTFSEKPRSCRGCPVLSSSLYADCQPAELDLVAENREYHIYEPGEEIFTQGQAIKGICCIYDGRVALDQRKRDGQVVTLHVAEKGETIGLPDLMEETCHTRSAVALERTEVCFVPMESFRQLFATVGPVTIRTIQSICRRILDAERRVTPHGPTRAAIG